MVLDSFCEKVLWDSHYNEALVITFTNIVSISMFLPVLHTLGIPGYFRWRHSETTEHKMTVVAILGKSDSITYNSHHYKTFRGGGGGGRWAQGWGGGDVVKCSEFVYTRE